MSYTVLDNHFIPYPKDPAARSDIQHFGRVAKDWATSIDAIAAERLECTEGEEIKIVYFIRHGHSPHNPLPVPTKPHWPELLERTNKILDPALTPIGEGQTIALKEQIQQELQAGMPPPTKIIASVARRTCQTAVEVWGDTVPDRPVEALHDIRDRLNGHLFTQLTPHSEKKRLFPQIRFDPSAPEEDKLAMATKGWETHEALHERGIRAWEDLWRRAKGHDCISVVAHQDPLLVFWTKVFGLEEPNFEKAEMRVIVVKRSL